MIDRQHGHIVFECDSCDEVFDTETDDFADALAMIKRDDWKVRKIAGEWIHCCGRCGVPT
jgi:uncharacterized C2H2 Zn-finger protein